MNLKENAMAVLLYEPYEKMPIVSFGYWSETVEKWAEEGYISQEDAQNYNRYGDNGPGDKAIMEKIGFDFNWNACVGGNNGLFPFFEEEVLEVDAQGARTLRNNEGLIIRITPGAGSIPSEVGTTLTDRKAWEELYLPKLQYDCRRVDIEGLRAATEAASDTPIGLHCGSLYGSIRNLLGVVHLSYLYVDDEDLYTEIIDTMGNLSYQVTEKILKSGIKVDFAHFWEDICFKNGPLVSPAVFKEKVGPHYKRITDLLQQYGIDIVSLDCDGCIDKLVPIWLENGVNTMFPIEYGTWGGNIAPWRAQYGKAVRGVGGMNKTVFSKDKKAVDEEVERLLGLIALGGYIPCPDHRIAPDAKFELVAYYCERLRSML